MLIGRTIIAMAEVYGEDSVQWLAIARHKSGVTLMREANPDDLGPKWASIWGISPIVGAFFPFTRDTNPALLLRMSAKNLEAIGMSADVYASVNALLTEDYFERVRGGS